MKLFLKFIIAFLTRFRILIISGTVLGALIFLFVIKVAPQISFRDRDTIGYVGRFEADNLPYEISSMISRGLVSVSDSSNITADLANSWSVEDSGKKWVFDIDMSSKWQDGSAIELDDINYSFSDVSISKENNTLTFKLKEPYIPFIVLLEKPIFKKGLLGLGDWRVTRMTLKSGYIQSLDIKNGKDNKTIKFYPTEEQAKFAFKMGEIDSIKNLSSVGSFDEWENVFREEEVKYNQVVVIFFNTADPLLSDKNMRLALNYAVDKSQFSNRALGPINPNSYYYNPQVKEYLFDLEKAQDLMKDIKAPLPDDYTLNLISTPNLIDTAELVSNMWNDIGVKSNVLVSSIIPSDYQAFITIFDIPKDPDQYSLWHSTQLSSNITKYKNARIDILLEEGRVQSDKVERKNIYLDFQRFLIEDSPAIFLFHPVCYNIARK